MIKMLMISRALYGEMYFDLSDDTKLTLGARYQEDETYFMTYNDTGALSLDAGWWFLAENRDTCSFVDVTTVADDAFLIQVSTST